MTKKNIFIAIFSDKYSSFKLFIALFSQLFLFIIFLEYQNTFNPLGMSLLSTTSIVIIYTWLKIFFYDNVNKKKETSRLVMYIIVFILSVCLAIFHV
ncbi:hypothetical protein ACW2QC_16775 [Virgibacillus sp. FSP13]